MLTTKTDPKTRIEVPPDDEHNREMVRNVHPPDWENPRPAPRYNLVVIGAGTAGLVSAAGAAAMGGRVALVEKHLMGGDCLVTGCVPSKAIIRSSRVCADIRDADTFGVRIPPGVVTDFAAVMERMRSVRTRISYHDSARRFAEIGVDVFLGEARFSGRDTVEVGGLELLFKKAVIATGASHVVPPIPGLREAGYLTNESVFNLTERPDRLLVIGGGPLGCELAQAFGRLGSRVTIVEMDSQFLPREDRDAADILARAFAHDRIDTRLNSTVGRVVTSGNDRVVYLETDGKEHKVVVDQILVGVGRAPNVNGLNLEAAGVEYDRSGVSVNDYLQTTNRRVFAAGDVCLPYKFTHTADAAARIVIQNALFLGRKKFSAVTIPWCTYTDPEIAHVGLNEQEARIRGVRLDTIMAPLDGVDRALADGEDQGFVKVHVRQGSDKIVGATVVARHAGEMISEITLAMVGGIGLKKIAGVIHPYPTQAEAIKKTADEYNRRRLTPMVRRVLSWWLALSR